MAATLSERLKRFNIYKFILTIPGILIVYSLMFLIYFLLRNQPNGNNPVFFQLGDRGPTFRWYGIIITAGVIIAAFLTQYLSARRGENPDRTWVLLPVVLVSGIIGARFWYVINTWSKYKDHIFSIGDPNAAGVIEIWRGGIAIQGAVIGGAIGVAIYKWLTGLHYLRWADFIAPGLIIAQACGRWGNFMNNEAYGRPTNLPWGVKIPCEYRTTGGTPGTVDTTCPATSPDQLFHPTFFYESVWDYAVFLTLFFAITKPKTVERWTKIRLRDGDIFFLYLVLYSIGRFIVESLRTDPLYIIGDPVNGGIRSAQMLSIIFIFVGAVGFLYRHRQRTPDNEALSVKVRPEPTKQELRKRQMATATAGAVAGGATTASAILPNEAQEEADEEAETVEEVENETGSEVPPVEAEAEPEATAELENETGSEVRAPEAELEQTPEAVAETEAEEVEVEDNEAEPESVEAKKGTSTKN